MSHKRRDTMLRICFGFISHSRTEDRVFDLCTILTILVKNPYFFKIISFSKVDQLEVKIIDSFHNIFLSTIKNPLSKML
ncbi:hypothetical protein BpHYR1_036044 [Brachionus plicatilis]|uniref:Uncharacterized protein n=1 Tax=Brachionus plicatilis TaxID=10195 RepID=A0A3M7RZG4_BRAPC|nr:hypothetical protein BpHYR1_036044 [Brachionus plicatilis]